MAEVDEVPNEINANASGEDIVLSDKSAKSGEAGYHPDKDGGDSSSSEASNEAVTKKDSGGYDEDSESGRQSNAEEESEQSDQEEIEAGSAGEETIDAENKPEADAKDDAQVEEQEGYEEESESGSEESDVPSDSQRRKDSHGYQEESEEEGEPADDIETGGRKRKSLQKRQSKITGSKHEDSEASEGEGPDVVVESGEDENKDDEKEEDKSGDSNDDGDDEEEEEAVPAPAIVPRRSNFWDHDDRFDDMPIEQSRFPRDGRAWGNKKLWDRSSEKWEHDMYVEEEQGPKEEWEKLGPGQYEQRRRRQRTVGDFVEGERGGRGGYGGRGGRGGGGRRESQDVRSNDRQRDDRRSVENERDDEPNRQDDNEDSQQRRRPVERENKERNNPTSYRDDDRRRVNEKPEENSYRSFRQKPSFHKDEEASTRSQQNHDRDHRESDRVASKNRKYFNRDGSDSAQKASSSAATEKEEPFPVLESKSAERKPASTSAGASANEEKPSETAKGAAAKGRGRGIVSDHIKKGQKTAADFERESKLQKANEKIRRHKLRDAEPEEVSDEKFENADEVQDEPKASVKPKRYSSQRLKQAGADEVAVDEQASFAPEYPPVQEDVQYYQQIGYPQDNIYAAQMASMLQQPNMPPPQGMEGDGNSMMMMHQYLQQQMLQLQMHQMRLRQQQQQPAMMPPVGVMDASQPDMVPMPGAPSNSYIIPSRPMVPYPQMAPAAENMPLPPQQLTPEQYQMMTSQMMAAPRMFVPQPGGGLFVPNQMQQQQQQQQPPPPPHVVSSQSQQPHPAEGRPPRRAAIPIKSPPEPQTAET